MILDQGLIEVDGSEEENDDGNNDAAIAGPSAAGAQGAAVDA